MQTMRSNKETVLAISKDIQSLNAIIDSVVLQVRRRSDRLQMKEEKQNKMYDDLQASSEWQERVDGLQRYAYSWNVSYLRNQRVLG